MKYLINITFFIVINNHVYSNVIQIFGYLFGFTGYGKYNSNIYHIVKQNGYRNSYSSIYEYEFEYESDYLYLFTVLLEHVMFKREQYPICFVHRKSQVYIVRDSKNA